MELHLKTAISSLAIAAAVLLPEGSWAQRARIERSEETRSSVGAPYSANKTALEAARSASPRAPSANIAAPSAGSRARIPVSPNAGAETTPAPATAVRRRASIGSGQPDSAPAPKTVQSDSSEFVSIEAFTTALSAKADAAALAATQQAMRQTMLDIFEKQDKIMERFGEYASKTDLDEAVAGLEQQIMHSGSASAAGEAGADGRELELRATPEFIQWRYVGEGQSAWRDLIDMGELKGERGEDGRDGEPGESVVLADDPDLSDFPADAKPGTWVLGVQKGRNGQVKRTWVRINGQN